MPDVANAFAKRYRELGGQVILEPYLIGINDFKTKLTKIRESEALLFLGNDESGLAMKQARELDLQGSFYGLANLISPQIIKVSQGTVDDTIVVSWQLDEPNMHQLSVQEKIVSRLGRRPYIEFITYQIYDASQILLHEVLPKITTTDKKERITQIKKALLEIKDYPGVMGNLTMESNGKISGIELSTYQIKNGELIPVE